MYMVSVGSSPNTTDVANLTRFSSKTHYACVELEPDTYLIHNQKYFSKVYAFNGAHKQLNVSLVSDGGMHYTGKQLILAKDHSSPVHCDVNLSTHKITYKK